MNALDLSVLDQFKASDLLCDTAPASRGKPLDVDLALIDFDPGQPRRSLRTEDLAPLAASINAEGVLEPVSLRSHPQARGRYIINRGERRVRASRAAGKKSIPAFIDERVDRFAQAIENLQREDLTPFDLATFIAERQAEDPKLLLSDIATKLHKPKSFITEVAGLIGAPEELRQAFDSGRVRDTRALYLLARAAKKERESIRPILQGTGSITRDRVEAFVSSGAGACSANGNGEERFRSPPSAAVVEKPKKLANALLVEYHGRRGRLGWTRQPTPKSAEVHFEDGERKTVLLADLKLLAWTMR